MSSEVKPVEPEKATVVVPLSPTPIEDFNNSGLRESITKALEGVPAGHGHALLDISSKGVGVMVVERFNESWALVAAVRYSRTDGVGAQAALQVSW